MREGGGVGGEEEESRGEERETGRFIINKKDERVISAQARRRNRITQRNTINEINDKIA